MRILQLGLAPCVIFAAALTAAADNPGGIPPPRLVGISGSTSLPTGHTSPPPPRVVDPAEVEDPVVADSAPPPRVFDPDEVEDSFVGGNPPPRRAIDYLPPDWTTFDINWQPTWDQTLAANKEQEWQKELSQNKALCQAAAQIVGLRKIELLKAMIRRFPAEKDKHAGAYRDIARKCQQIGLRWWSSYYGWKLAREFPQRKDLLPAAYMKMMSWQFGGCFDPEWHDWEFAVREAVALAEAGTIRGKHDAVRFACTLASGVILSERRYDEFLVQLNRFEKLGTWYPKANHAAARLLVHFGHTERAWAFHKKSDPSRWWHPGNLASSPLGGIGSLPRDRDLEDRWKELTQDGRLADPQTPIRADQFQQLLDLAIGTDAYLHKSRSHCVPLRTMIDQTLAELQDGRLLALREAQEKAVRDLVPEVRREGNWDQLIRLSRRYPLARSVHELLVEFAEQALREHRRHWAIPALRNVLRHACDPRLRLEARVGLWLALAEEPGDGKALGTAMAQVPDNAQLPWRGGKIAAGQLKKVLRARARAGADQRSVKLSDLRRVPIELPRTWPGQERHEDGPVTDYGLHAPWPVNQVQASGKTLFVSGPGRIACFGTDGGAPLWVRAAGEAPRTAGAPWDVKAAAQYMKSSWWMAFHRRPVTVPGPQSAAVAGDGRALYCLLNRRTPSAVAALDASTGKRLWSTEASGDWQELEPMSQPAVAEGRVYVLALPANPGKDAGTGPDRQAGPPIAWHLVCLDADNGRMLWKRPIGWQAHTLLDLARCGSAVAIHNGAVYCLTNMGIVARCDARDGTPEWVRGYGSAVNTHPHAKNFSREGTSPLVLGNMLLVAPRDHSGVLAYRCDTGWRIWEAVMVPSDRLVGVSGEVLITMNEHWLSALEVATGQPVWYREFPKGTGSRAAVIGQDVVLISGGKLRRISAATGRTLELLDLGPSGEPEYVILRDGATLEVKPPRLAPGNGPETAGGTPLQLPMAEAWTIPCQNPTLLFPQDQQAPDGAFCVLSGRRLGCVRSGPSREMAWERIFDHPPQSVRFEGNLVLLATGQRLTALGAADGVRRWSVGLPFLPYVLGGDKGLVFAATARNSWSYAAVIDAAAGKLLWTRSFGERLRTNNNVQQTILRRQPDGSATLQLYWQGVLFGNEGWRPGEMVLDAGTGRVKQVKRFLPELQGWPAHLVFDADSIRYFGQDTRLHVVPHSGGPDPAAEWQRKFDLSVAGRYPGSFGHHATASALYVRLLDRLFFFDVATKKELLYELPKGAPGTLAMIFDFREMDTKLVVVSGVRGQDAAYDVANTRMFVDLFDRKTGQHLGRQNLSGISCRDFNVNGYQTQAQILKDAIIVTDPGGVHVFAPKRL